MATLGGGGLVDPPIAWRMFLRAFFLASSELLIICVCVNGVGVCEWCVCVCVCVCVCGVVWVCVCVSVNGVCVCVNGVVVWVCVSFKHLLEHIEAITTHSLHHVTIVCHIRAHNSQVTVALMYST